MSEDDNDRMERAHRIREMREGRRSAPLADEAAEEDADDPADSDTDEASDAGPDDPAGGDVDDADDGGGETGDDGGTDAAITGDLAESEPEGGDAGDGPDGEAARASDRMDEILEGEGVDAEPEEGAARSEPEPEPEPDEEVVESGFDFGGTAEAEAGTRTGAANATETGSAGPDAGIADPDVREAVDRVDGLSGGFAIPDQATSVTEEGTGGALGDTEEDEGGRTTVGGDAVRVLEFELGDERYCVDIEYIEEIVELESITRVPNSPSYVEGVVDLRGQVTAILDPADELDAERTAEDGLIVVFDSGTFDEQGHLGWIVDEVRQVTPIREEEVNESPEDEEHVNGIVNREDEDDLVVWTSPELALNS